MNKNIAAKIALNFCYFFDFQQDDYIRHHTSSFDIGSREMRKRKTNGIIPNNDYQGNTYRKK